MGETKKDGMELSIMEGEKTEKGTREGEILKGVRKQETPQKDTELLKSINQKLDLLLAAQNIS